MLDLLKFLATQNDDFRGGFCAVLIMSLILIGTTIVYTVRAIKGN
jgi:hypothetical protein